MGVLGGLWGRSWVALLYFTVQLSFTQHRQVRVLCRLLTQEAAASMYTSARITVSSLMTLVALAVVTHWDNQKQKLGCPLLGAILSDRLRVSWECVSLSSTQPTPLYRESEKQR